MSEEIPADLERGNDLGLDRFDWQSFNAECPSLCRRRAALRFDRVNACKCKHVSPQGKGAVLNLLEVAA